MCGLVGALSFDQSAFRVSELYLIRACATVLTHQGPDGAGGMD